MQMSMDRWQAVSSVLLGAADEIERLQGEIGNVSWMEIQKAKGQERETCARMAREYARAMSKGTHPRVGSVEEIGERIAAHIEIPF